MTLDDATTGAVPRDPPRRSAAGAHLGRDRKAAAARAAAVDRFRARAGARRRRSAVSGTEGARRMRAGAGVASRRRRVGPHAAGDRSGAAAHRRSRSRRSAHRDARRGDATISASRRRRRFLDGRIRSINHEEEGVAPASAFLDRLNIHSIDGKDVRGQVLGLVAHHLKPGMLYKVRERAHRRRVPPPVAESQPRAARARREVRLPGPRARQLRLLGDGLVSRARARARRRSQPAEAAAARTPPARARHDSRDPTWARC